MEAECDVSVSKLLGFETFPFFRWFRFRYRKKFGIEKSIGFGIEKNWYRKKVSDSVSLRFWVSSHTVYNIVINLNDHFWVASHHWRSIVEEKLSLLGWFMLSGGL